MTQSSCDPVICYLGLGSNIGDGKSNIQCATNRVAALDGVKLIESSSYYHSLAWGNTNQDNFVNSVISIQTSVCVFKLLQLIQNIEKQMGRQKREKWGPRIIDIDILLYSDSVVNQQQLIVPHPYIVQRSFVLAPLLEINPKLNHPLLNIPHQKRNRKALNDGIISIDSL